MAENVIVQDAQGDAVVHHNVSGVELLTESGGTATFIHNAEIKQSDWNQADISQKDYIKNKPILRKVATTGSYNDLLDRPCGDAQDVVPETEAEFAGDEEDDGFVGWGSQTEVGLVVGESYIVTWGDKEFTCTAKHASDIVEGLVGGVFLGNAILFLNAGFGEDTGEPFIFTYNPDMLPGDNNCGFWTNETDATRTVRVRPVEGTIKLDAKYLPDGLATEDFVEQKISEIEVSGGDSSTQVQSDWNETDETSPAFIKNKPDIPGGGTAEVDIFPEQTVEGFSGGGTQPFDGYYDISGYSELTVVWDGEEYTVAPVYMEEGSIAGNLSLAEVGDDTGEPFLFVTAPPETAGNETGTTMFYTDDTTATSHTIRIYQKTSSGGVSGWNDLTDKPFGETEAVLFDGVFQDELTDTDGDGTNDAWLGEMIVQDDSPYTLVVGQTYKVTWNGVEYECECFGTEAAIPAMGNPAAFGDSDNGMPFIIIRDASGQFVGAPAWIATTMEPPADLTASGTYTCKIEGTVVQTLDSKYIPGPPEFDLTAMGLSDVIGSDTQVECDTAEILNALAKGAVKLRFTMDGQTVSVIPTITKIGDQYLCYAFLRNGSEFWAFEFMFAPFVFTALAFELTSAT